MLILAEQSGGIKLSSLMLTVSPGTVHRQYSIRSNYQQVINDQIDLTLGKNLERIAHDSFNYQVGFNRIPNRKSPYLIKI